MRYDHRDEDLLKFLKDPITNVEVLAKRTTQSKKIERLFFRLHFFRKFLSSNSAKTLFYELVSSVHSSAIAELEKNSIINSAPFEQSAHRISHNLNSLFEIRVDISIPDNAEEALLDFKERHRNAKAEYHCNRVMELYPLQGNEAFPLHDLPNVWRLFFLSEMVFLIETQQMSVRVDNSGFLIERNEAMLSEVPAYWIAETSESTSNIADRLVLNSHKKMNGALHAVSPQQLIYFVAFVMDKVFSIQADYISSSLRSTNSYRLFWDVVAFSILIDLYCKDHIRTILKSELRRMRLIREDNLDFIDSIVTTQEQSKFSDFTGFISENGERYVRGRISFKYGIKRFVGAVLHAYYMKTKENFFGLYGEEFETDFIFNKIKDFGLKNYKLFEGLEPKSSNSQVQDYDVDIILHHVTQDKFYFIQVKYFASFIPTYLSEQCEFTKHPRFLQGVQQLLGLKGRLNEQSIKQRLEKKGLGGATNENSHFLMVHNIPFLNFFEYKGVFLYEWNLFRNLLSGGTWTKFSGDDVEEHCMNIDFQFEDPHDCAIKYIEGGMMEGAYEASFYFFLNSKSILKFKDFSVVSDML